MPRKKQGKKNKTVKKVNIFVKIYRFFVPKNVIASLYEGMQRGAEIRGGRHIEKAMPTWWIGKGLRKLIDPKHKMKVGKKDE